MTFSKPGDSVTTPVMPFVSRLEPKADLITEETMVVSISHKGYIKRTPVSVATALDSRCQVYSRSGASALARASAVVCTSVTVWVSCLTIVCMA